jgi:glycosyltransferase involved in cell wall biosynthesis
MINWTSMAVADAVVFNSDFHRRVWFEAVPTLLRSLPDHRHDRLVDAVAARSSVVPVGVDLRRLDGPSRRGDRPLVLWNQRGEHDKGPDEFAAAVTAAFDRGADFEVALAGQRFVSEPLAFDRLRAALGDRVVHDGYADEDAYVDLLRRSDVVVSTAHQEFFGVAVTEAVYAGAFPLLPDRLVYPERIPAAFHGRCLHHGGDDLVDRLVGAVTDRVTASAVAAELRPVMASCDWSQVAPRYDQMLEGIS